MAVGRAQVAPGCSGAFGNNVQVGAGNLWVRCAHLEAVLVSDGDQVCGGHRAGAGGFSTGPYLHFEVDRGCPTVGCSVDPANLISLPVGA
jgi:murein DD-endopeptidase MepM/ murein hydrolase activator NlpD